MKTTPLLFRAEMVRAILDGRKTQTRRLVKPQPGDVHFEELPKTDPVTGWQIAGRSYRWSDDDATGRIWTPPIGVPGDQIWVRETWALRGSAADMTAKEIREITHKDILRDDLVYRADSDGYDAASQGWRPSIFMPRWASRITLELTAVRVAKLDSISEADALAEGVPTDADYPIDNGLCPKCSGAGVHQALAHSLGVTEVDCCECDTARKRYKHLWESINGKGSWAANPFVWVYEFKKL